MKKTTTAIKHNKKNYCNKRTHKPSVEADWLNKTICMHTYRRIVRIRNYCINISVLVFFVFLLLQYFFPAIFLNTALYCCSCIKISLLLFHLINKVCTILLPTYYHYYYSREYNVQTSDLRCLTTEQEKS